MKQRLDLRLVELGLVSSRSQAETYIKLGEVTVNSVVITKSGYLVDTQARIVVTAAQQYVSRAALKLASVAQTLGLDFSGRLVLDVGSSTGGFTDYALRAGARRVIAVELGTDQLHSSLRADFRVELHEKTDIRDVRLALKPVPESGKTGQVIIEASPDIVLADVSFVSLREILPSVATLCSATTRIVAMVKPQFEAAQSSLKHKGVVKNDTLRRAILKDFEAWAQNYFSIISKADSAVAGAKGNRERFYLLRKLS